MIRVPLLPGVSPVLMGVEPSYDDYPPSGYDGKQLSAACSDDQVVVSCQASHSGGENDEVVIKYKGGAAPETRQMFVAVYRDKWGCRPLETWQVFLHSLRRVDLSAVVGQTCDSHVVVKGQGVSRRVRCYSSHPDELQVGAHAGRPLLQQPRQLGCMIFIRIPTPRCAASAPDQRAACSLASVHFHPFAPP